MIDEKDRPQDGEEQAQEQPDTQEIKSEEVPQEKAAKKDKKAKKERTEEPEAQPSVEDSLRAELASLNDKYLRICAEYDNFRKRSQKEKDALYGDIKADTLKKFLPVYDNLVRALEQSTADEAYRKGVELIMAQFNATMEKLGVTEIQCLGEKFDPQFHNAVMHVEDEEKGENEIVEVFQKGFMMGDKPIRFAVVKVAN